MSFQSGGGLGIRHAFVLSILFHLLLLWPSLSPWPAANPAQPLVAILRPVAPPVPAAETRKSVPAERREEPRAVEHAAPPITVDEKLHHSTVENNSRSETTAPSASVPASVSAAPVSPQPAAAAATAGQPPREGLDAEGLRGYRLALGREARRFKRYPVSAIEAGWGGTAQVRVRLAAGGVPQGVELARTSGHDVLDEAALEMIRRALPLAAVPASLRERAFAVDLPVVFEVPD